MFAASSSASSIPSLLELAVNTVVPDADDLAESPLAAADVMMPFPKCQLDSIIAAVDRDYVVALCGPAGSGKHTLLSQAFPELCVLRLEEDRP
jgi:type IV secretory pathway ATPase VirB11/archaellum biosynthesis ATPase